MNKIVKLVLAIALCATAATAAAGDTARATATTWNATVVRFGDLNLETEAGVKKLYVRLQVAAKDVCNVHTSWAGLQQKSIEDRCVSAAIGAAIVKINRTHLTAYHRAKTGHKDEQVLSKL